MIEKNNRLGRRQRYSNFIFVSIFFLNEQNAKQKFKIQKQLWELSKCDKKLCLRSVRAKNFMDREQFRDGLGSCAPIRYVFFFISSGGGGGWVSSRPGLPCRRGNPCTRNPWRDAHPNIFFEFLHTLLEYEKRTGRLLTNSEGGAWFWKVFLVRLLVGFCVQNVEKNS